VRTISASTIVSSSCDIVMATCSSEVFPICWIVQAISKHIVAQEALSGGYKSISIDKSANFGIIIPALEVIEAGFGVVDIAAVAQGVVGAEGGSKVAGGGKGFAPGIVGVADHCRAAAVEDGGYIALQVGGVVVGCAVVGDGYRGTAGIIAEVQRIAANGHAAEAAAVIHIAVGGGIVGSLGP